MTQEELIDEIIKRKICKREHVDAITDVPFDDLENKETIIKLLRKNLAEWQQFIMKKTAEKGCVNIDTFNLLFSDITIGKAEKVEQRVNFEAIIKNITEGIDD